LSGEIVDSSLPSESSFQSGSGSDSADKTSIFDEIDRQMSDLQNEIDKYGLLGKTPNNATTNGATDNSTDNYDSSGDETPPPPPEFTREVSPPPLPPPCVMPGTTPPTSNSTYMMLTKPSLPEPEGPPPPPPVQNGYAFNTPHVPQEVRNPLGNLASKNNDTAVNNANSNAANSKPKEPIYESIKPRPEPLGGPAEDEQPMEYGFAMTQQQQQQRTVNRRPPLPQIPVQNQNGVYGKSPLEMEREARRMVRVRRELERIQVPIRFIAT